MITDREKEFEDGLFYGALATEQNMDKQDPNRQLVGVPFLHISVDKEQL